MQCIKLEHEEPMTVNEDTLGDYKSIFLTHYRAMSRTQRPGVDKRLQSFINGEYDGNTNFVNATTSLSHLGFPGLNRQDLLRLLKPGGVEDEVALDIMAECRAYYQGE